MEDQQGGTSSALRVSDIRYGATVPDDLFDPKNLAKTAEHPLWSSQSQ
jgi:hypothetical protein